MTNTRIHRPAPGGELALLDRLTLAGHRDRREVHQQVLRWQAVAGNQAVGRAIRRAMGRRIVRRTPGQPRPAPIQRDYSESDYTTVVTKPIKVVVTLGKPGTHSETIEVKTNDDVAKAYAEIVSAMFFDRNEFFPDTYDNEFYEEWSNLDDDISAMARWYAGQPKTEAVYIAEVKDVQKRLREAKELALKCRSSYLKKEAKFKKELAKARSKVLQAEKDAKKLLRAKFLTGEGGGDLTSSFLWTMTDHLFTFGGSLADAMDLPYPQALAYGKVLPGAVTIANVVVNWSSKSPGTMGSALEGLSDLNNVISVAGAVNSFIVNPAYLITAYVGPMLSAITGMLGKLQTQLVERNDDAAAFLGKPLYPGAEPGGAAMWDYMVTAMRASSAADIPKPSGGVFKYFDKFRTRFDEAGKAKYAGELESYKSGERTEFPTKPGAIPTESSYLVFSDVSADKFPGWLFANRQMVWTLLYGARDPKGTKLTTER